MSAFVPTNAPASEAAASTVGLQQPATNPDIAAKAGATAPQKERLQELQEIYTREKDKRMRPEGAAQYFDLTTSDKYKHLSADIWAEKDQNPKLSLENGMHTKIFITGAGFGGLQYAVRFVQQGINPDDIILADVAGGFGGTWYWNRYPGLMCDVESYIYLPFLEETGYMPKHRYSYGQEIREHVHRIAKHWKLHNRGAFQQMVQNLDWDDTAKCWKIKTFDLARNKVIELTSEFVVITPGLLLNPKLSHFQGLDKFAGHSFHTARWDYDYTGGSQEDPSMTGLQGKRVGIIGTGATAIQTVPHLAKWAKELYVFQRTASGVDERGQRATDPEDFQKNIGNQPGWQRERSMNFTSFLTNVQPRPAQDLVNDGWSNFPAYTALLGGPTKVDMTNVVDHVGAMHVMDAPRSERIRKRVDDLVNDPGTAEKLKPWYPGWCKRPCFHDEYLQTFNQPHVHLVDTDGKGIDRLTEKGVVAGGVEHELDCIIFSTGYDLKSNVSPTSRAQISTHGRNGRSLDEKWSSQMASVHGVLSHDFPNMFFSGPFQAAATANYSSALDVLAQHSAAILARAMRNAGSDRVVVEASAEGEEEWTMRIASAAAAFAAMAGCLPSYFNAEGDMHKMSQEEQMKAARSAMWGRGMNDFIEVIEAWRSDGKLSGLVVEAVS